MLTSPTVSLTDDQQKAIDKFSQMKVGALFMKMGSGKTMTACLLANKKPIDKVLWITKKTLVPQTKEQIEEHLDKPFDIHWYEEISSSTERFLQIHNKVDENTLIIADESLCIKNPWSMRSKRLLRLGEKTDWKMILNGTPISKHALDLYTQMNFLSPRILGMSEGEFRSRFLVFWEDDPSRVIRSENIDVLTAMIEPYTYESDLFIDVTSKDYTYNTILSGDSQWSYEEYKRDELEKIDEWDMRDIGKYDFFSIIAKFHTFLLSLPDHYETLKRCVSRILDKALIFTKHKAEQYEIDRQLPNCYIINGDCTMQERAETVEAFRADESEEAFLLLTFGVGAFGLNLQFVHHVIFFSHQWDHALQEQAEHRVFRLGQKNNVSYHYCYIEVGLEDMIRNSLSKKASLNREFKQLIEKRSKKELKEWLKSM